MWERGALPFAWWKTWGESLSVEKDKLASGTLWVLKAWNIRDWRVLVDGACVSRRSLMRQCEGVVTGNGPSGNCHWRIDL